MIKGIFKRLENIKDKKEELLNAFIPANKVSKTAKDDSDFNYSNKFTFYDFREALKILIEWYR